MAKIYRYNENIFKDLMLNALMFDEDISSKRFRSDFQNEVLDILGYVLTDNKDIKYLDFDITNDNGYYKITAYNILTALWFNGIFPIETKEVLINNTFQYENKHYKFNKKTNQFTYNIVSNDKNRND